jgi:hypothetical protein
MGLCLGLLALLLAALGSAAGQVIHFESGGLKFQTLTRRGLTVMFAHLPVQLREYSILQVSISNGSAAPVTARGLQLSSPGRHRHHCCAGPDRRDAPAGPWQP